MKIKKYFSILVRVIQGGRVPNALGIMFAIEVLKLRGPRRGE